MPKLWHDTIEAHRREVRDAIMGTAAALVAEHGLLAVTMTQIAQETGIGRATLYKYFPGVEEILHAWHERQITGHLDQLTTIAHRNARAVDRLRAVLEGFARIQRDRHAHASQAHGAELTAFLHADDSLAPAQRHLLALIEKLVTESVADGELRTDVPPNEASAFCLNALAGATSLTSNAATKRLVTLTLDALRPSR